jgi:hypothetical protein
MVIKGLVICARIGDMCSREWWYYARKSDGDQGVGGIMLKGMVNRGSEK